MQAAVNATRELEWIINQLLDFTREDYDVEKQQQSTVMMRSSLIMDCKSLYDSVERQESAGLGLQEKRTAIEVTAIRQEMRDSHLSTK